MFLMLKAAAPDPRAWAATYTGLGKVDISEVNQVVRDYAYIELQASARKARRSIVGRIAARVMHVLAIAGICGPGIAAGVFASGGRVPETSEDLSLGFELSCIYLGSILGCVAILDFLVPWLRTSHRQWDRGILGVGVFLAGSAVVLLALIYSTDSGPYPRWMLIVPVWFLLVMALGSIVALFIFKYDSKPPAVDLDNLTAEETEVLMECRRKALVSLRSRSKVSYSDVDEYSSAALWV
jgi:hypothetical protein